MSNSMIMQYTTNVTLNTTNNKNLAINCTSDYQDALKILAIITMVIDHIGCFFYPDLLILRAVGRVAGFLFLFFAGYNYTPGKKFKSINLYLGLALTANWILFGWYLPLNVLITICAGYFCLKIITQQTSYNLLFSLTILLLVHPLAVIIMEFGTIGIFAMVCGYYYKVSQQKMIIIPALISIYVLNITFFPFSGFDIYLIAGLYIILYFLVTVQKFEQPIKYNLRAITKYSAMIYFLHVSAFMVIFMLTHN